MLYERINKLHKHNVDSITDILIDQLYEAASQRVQQDTFGGRVTEEAQEKIVDRAMDTASSIDEEFLREFFVELQRVLVDKLQMFKKL